MPEVEIKADFQSNIEIVWNAVTDNKNFNWRSGLTKIEAFEDGAGFREYALDGTATEFRIMKKEPFALYAFSIKNKNMQGYWTGKFYPKNGDSSTKGCTVVFTENVTAHFRLMNLFLKGYLRKQQRRYIQDLKRYLGEE